MTEGEYEVGRKEWGLGAGMVVEGRSGGGRVVAGREQGRLEGDNSGEGGRWGSAGTSPQGPSHSFTSESSIPELAGVEMDQY